MKKVTLFLLLLVVALSMNSQTLLESDSYGLDQYIEKCSDIPVLRQLTEEQYSKSPMSLKRPGIMR